MLARVAKPFGAEAEKIAGLVRNFLDALLDLKPDEKNGRHLRDSIEVDARDKLLEFMT